MTYAQIATTYLFRCEQTGLYSVHVDFGTHAEAIAEIQTLDQAQQMGFDLIRAELRSRKTIEVTAP